MFGRFLLAFVPLLVAIDPVGLVPMYLSLSSPATPRQRRAAAVHAVLTAFLVGVGFLFLGKLTFRVLGIDVPDFQIAGGIILLVIAVQDLVTAEVQNRVATRDFGVVPLGLPLIAGPGMVTTLLTLGETLGAPLTLAALILNLLLVLLALRVAETAARIFGVTSMRAISRLVSLLLAAIAVNLIRRGWQSLS